MIPSLGSHSVQATSNRLIHAHHFVYTLQKVYTPDVRWPNAKKPENRSLLADLGHFLTSDVILKENFCRLASIWLIGLMKLFALGRTDLAVGS